jgi:hypothetical protein
MMRSFRAQKPRIPIYSKPIFNSPWACLSARFSRARSMIQKIVVLSPERVGTQCNPSSWEVPGIGDNFSFLWPQTVLGYGSGILFGLKPGYLQNLPSWLSLGCTNANGWISILHKAPTDGSIWVTIYVGSIFTCLDDGDFGKPNALFTQSCSRNLPRDAFPA